MRWQSEAADMRRKLLGCLLESGGLYSTSLVPALLLCVLVRPGKWWLEEQPVTFPKSGSFPSQYTSLTWSSCDWETEFLIGMFHRMYSYFRELLDTYLKHIYTHIYVYFLASSFTSFLTPLYKFLRINNKVNHCTAVVEPIKLMKKIISLVLLHWRRQIHKKNLCLW